MSQHINVFSPASNVLLHGTCGNLAFNVCNAQKKGVLVIKLALGVGCNIPLDKVLLLCMMVFYQGAFSIVL